jgi:hypothetical protein
MIFYLRRNDLPPMRAFRGLELFYDGQFFIIGQVFSAVSMGAERRVKPAQQVLIKILSYQSNQFVESCAFTSY